MFWIPWELVVDVSLSTLVVHLVPKLRAAVGNLPEGWSALNYEGVCSFHVAINLLITSS